MAIFVMLNNFFHDFTVALLFSSLFILSVMLKYYEKDGSLKNIEFFRHLYKSMTKVIIGSWIFIIVGGIIRTVNYYEYEWMEAAGKGQITALIIKHILLITLVVWGSIIHVRLKKKLASPEERNS